MTELETKLLGALKEMTSIVEIHSEATSNNFAWAELDAAHEAIAAAEAAQPDEVQRAVEAEREACARLCETAEIPINIDVWMRTKKELSEATAIGLAAAIRSRGNKQ